MKLNFEWDEEKARAKLKKLRSLIPSAPKRVAMTREAQSTYTLRRVTKLKRANR